MFSIYRFAIFASLLLLTSNALAQERRTPLGVQRSRPGQPAVQPRPVPSETPSAALARAATAHGAALASGQIADSVARGRLTYFTVQGPGTTFDVTVLRKGDRRVQRIIKQAGVVVREGSDGGRVWASSGAFSALTAGRARQFIESQTVRSIPTLLKRQTQTLRHVDVTDDARIIEAEDPEGQKTSYSIDARTSAITKVQFVTGESKDPFSGRLIPDVESYIFSDFRTVQGVLTPFKVERYINGFKAEETQFTSVSYNASLHDGDFHP
jgi:hypothetical protein